MMDVLTEEESCYFWKIQENVIWFENALTALESVLICFS